MSNFLDEEEDERDPSFLSQLRDRYDEEDEDEDEPTDRADRVADDYLGRNAAPLEELGALPVWDIETESRPPPIRESRDLTTALPPSPYTPPSVPKRMESLVGNIPDPSPQAGGAAEPEGFVGEMRRSARFNRERQAPDAPGGLGPARQRGTAPAAPVPRPAPRTISDYTGPGGEGAVPSGDETSRVRRPYSIPEWLRPEERVTPSETTVHSPPSTAMSTAGDGRMQHRRADVDVASRLPTRDTEEAQPGFGEAEGSMSFAQEEADAGVAGADAERERRSGLTLEQLIDEASHEAMEPTDAPVDNEALELALNRIDAGESEAEDEAAVESVAEDEMEEAAEAEGRELTDQERRDAAEDRTLWIQNIIRSGGNLAASLINAIAGGSPENSQRIVQASQQNRVAFAQELNAVRQSRHRRDRLAQEGEIRTRQAEQRDRQLDIQETGQEARIDVSRQDLEMRRLVTEAQAAALGRENEMVPEDELRGWWSSLNAQGRTGDQSQDDFAAQQWTRGELAANLNELEQPRGRGGMGGGSRRRRPRTGPPGTPPSGDDAIVVDGIPVLEWDDERVRKWDQMTTDQRLAFIRLGYRPPGWAEEGAAAVNPEALTEISQLDPSARTGLAPALSRYETQVGTARGSNPVTARSTGVMQRAGLPLAGRQIGSESGATLYMPRQAANMPNPTFLNRTQLQQRISNANRLDALEIQVRQQVAAYNRAVAGGASVTAAQAAAASGDGIIAGGQRRVARWLRERGEFSPETENALTALLQAEAAYEGTVALLRNIDNWGAVTVGEREVAQSITGSPGEPGLMGAFDPGQMQRYYAQVARMREGLDSVNNETFTQTPNVWTVDFSGLPGGESHPMNGRQMNMAQVRRAVERYISRNPNANMSGLSITAAR